MIEDLIGFIERLKAESDIHHLDEAVTKQTIVLRLLCILGWDIFNASEVKPEYSVRGQRVDFALRIGNTSKVFIEVKKTGENLREHQQQLLNYSFQEGVRLGVLTNGIVWWFYLPLREGSWEERKFCFVDLKEHDTNDVVSRFIDFLSKENVKDGKAFQKAEEMYEIRRKQSALEKTLPKAWNKIISDPPETLIGLISGVVEQLCGNRPDFETVKRFILNRKDKLLVSGGQTTPSSYPGLKEVHKSVRYGDYTGKPIRYFVFLGRRYEVHSWKGMLVRLAEVLHDLHSQEFEKVLCLGPKKGKKPYFSRNEEEMISPREIGSTGIYVETCLNANDIVRRCYQLLSVFGYKEEDLEISCG